MPDYRVYIIGSDGHFVDSVALECADDMEATEQAQQLVKAIRENPKKYLVIHLKLF